MSIGRVAGKAAAEQLIGLEEMLRKQNEKQLEQAQNGGQETAPVKSVLEAVKAANTNVMSGNFSRLDPENSRYVEASLNSMAVLKEQKRGMVAQVWANSDQLGGIQGKSRQLLEREALRKKLNEANEKIREEIEQKARETQVPKDAEGKPIPGAEVGAEAEVPKIASDPAVSAEIEKIGDAQIAAPEVTIKAPQQSIDIKV